MISMHKKIRWCMFLLLASIMNQSVATDTIKGDEAALPGQTFSFCIGQLAQPYAGHDIYVTAHPSEGGQGKVKQFALSRLSPSNNFFESITPEKVNLNIVKDQANPLFDQGIAFLGLLEGELAVPGSRERPIVVTHAEPSTIYLLNTVYNDQIEMVSAKDIPDATGQPTSGIVGLAVGRSHVFAATKPAGAGTSFGDPGSGVASLVLGVGALDNKPTFTVTDAMTGAAVGAPKKAAPLNRSSSVVKIGGDLASLSIADM